MYQIIAIASYIYRYIYLPNPFINSFSDPNLALLANMLGATVIIHYLSYGITHLYYNKGD